MMFDLTGKRALVTGASGGIGEECVKQLLNSGHYSQVYAVSRSSTDR